jgi:hypothetical protein
LNLPPDRAYPDLLALLAAHIVRDEYAQTAAVLMQVAPALARGYLTTEEFLAICRWKEPRQRMRRHWQRNDDAHVAACSRSALATNDERQRMEALLALHGVGIAVASALLTMLDPTRYGVIDVRAWQVLYRYGMVHTNPAGRGFSIEEWLVYLAVVRDLAAQFGVTARVVEHSLYLYHWKTGMGTSTA